MVRTKELDAHKARQKGPKNTVKIVRKEQGLGATLRKFNTRTLVKYFFRLHTCPLSRIKPERRVNTGGGMEREDKEDDVTPGTWACSQPRSGTASCSDFQN